MNEIIRKRGFLKKDDKRLPITDNAIVEEVLGEHNVICVEDIIDSHVKCGKADSNFKEVKKAIWPI